jgi:adenosylcobyric acid synthase
MFQGTGSDVGKSVLVAGLARALTRRGLAVRPFKPQNMSNNAAVTADGGEIGRAQALQALACGVPASVHMNPVLLKPQSEIGSQVVVQGRVLGTAKARDYQAMKPALMSHVQESFERLRREADVVLVEGAGSAAEVNLRAGDIANMGFATAAAVPVVLIGDINRGGVIASVCGTHLLLSERERALVCGYVINKFRGDISLFDSGLAVIGEYTQWPSLGVVPWSHAVSALPDEDAVALENVPANAPRKALKVAVLTLARIANFDDFDPLKAEPDVTVHFVRAGEAVPGDCDLLIIPGSKSTLADLAYLREQGWEVDLSAHVRRGGHVLGVCGGYQMLGHEIFDPERFEGDALKAPGLGLLNVSTTIEARKALRHVHGSDVLTGLPVDGYEMHMGVTTGPGLKAPMLHLDGAAHGALSPDGRVFGCYVHGVLAADAYRHALLGHIAGRAWQGARFENQVEVALDLFADHLEQHLGVDQMLAAAGHGAI